MTAADGLIASHTGTPPAITAPHARSPWRPLVAFGTGVAIEIAGDALEVAVLRVRPGYPEVIQRATIERFRERPATEWSEVFQEVVRGHDPAGVTVLLPRRDVIVRHVLLPGVTRRELAGALALRLRGLHPFPEDEMAWCWAPVANGALVGLMRLSVLGRYESLFAEAGVPVASFTFSASVLHAAVRLYGAPALPFLGISETQEGVFEAYGESATGVIFSGEFGGSAARAAAAGASELRLQSGEEAVGLARVLPQPKVSAEGEIPGIDRPVLYAAAVAAACPLFVRPANFLPAERRAGQSRIWLIPTAALAFLLVACTIAMLAIGPYRERSYITTLHQEINKVEPAAHRAATLDKETEHAREQILLLDNFRGRAQGDFEVLSELTRILPPPVWTSLVEVYPDYVIVSGEAEQAAPLLKIMDSSPLFHNCEFTNSVSRSGTNELFRIKALRRHK